MPTIIGFANLKGGCGKTTTAMHTAGGLVDAGYRVQVIDADEQATAYRWDLNDSLPFTVKSVPLIALERELSKIVRDDSVDVVLIDLPPHVASATSTVMKAANAIVVPVQPLRGDYEATSVFLHLLQDVLPKNPNLKMLMFINRKSAARGLERNARDFVTDLFKDVPNVKILETEVPDHTVIHKAHNAGITMFGFKEAVRTKALKAYSSLLQEVIECLSHA
jgi:chromosome partitioning protein